MQDLEILADLLLRLHRFESLVHEKAGGFDRAVLSGLSTNAERLNKTAAALDEYLARRLVTLYPV